MNRHRLEFRIVALEQKLKTNEPREKRSKLDLTLYSEDERALLQRAGELIRKSEEEARKQGLIEYGEKYVGGRIFIEFLSDEERETMREAARLIERKEGEREAAEALEAGGGASS